MRRLRSEPTAVEVLPFGTTAGGVPPRLFVLSSGSGLVAKLTDFGAALVELHAPDREGRLADVTGGFGDVAGYAGPNNQHFGSTVGRVANRIAGASFALDGREFRLAANLPPHHLHGGATRSLDKVSWRWEIGADAVPALTFRYRSPDGEEGYPGNVDFEVSYALTDGELAIEERATTDRATPVNLTNHAYWNLAGHGAGSVLGHELTLAARRYLPTDADLLPLGAVAPVAGTALDFTRPAALGARIGELVGTAAGGYDHSFVLDGPGGRAGEDLALAARLEEPRSGRILEVHTTKPCLQLYTGNGLNGQRGKAGAVYRRHGLVCLEAQRFPDAVHHPAFPPIVLRPGETYHHRTVYRFKN